jgi:hypothetical protein
MASAQILTNGKALYAYNGTEWVPLNTTGNLVNSTRWQYTAVGSETSLSGNDDNGESLIYTPGYEQVYLNGVLLARDADYTATTGTTITGLTALTAGYIVEIIAYNNINVGNTYTQGQIDNKIANTFTRWIDTLSASATVLSGLDDNSTTLSYTPGLEQVYVNGILLLPSEYTATSGSSVVLSEAAVSGDVIQIYTLKNFRVPNTYTIIETDQKFLTNTSASSTYLTQAAGITAATAATTYAPVAAGGLVQIVPTSVTTTGGSGSSSLVGNITFTSASSVSINDVFSTIYDYYLVHLSAEGSTSGIDINMRLRVSGSDNSSTVYTRSQIFQSSTTVSGQSLTGQTSWVGVGYATTSQRQFSQMTVINPFATQYSGLIRDAIDAINGTTTQLRTTYGSTITTSYTGFTIIPSTGNITGTITVYGYKK